MKKKISTVLLLTAASLIMANAFAENRAQALTLTLSEGYEFFDATRHVRSTGIPNIELGFNFTERWAIEGFVGAINSVSRIDTHEDVHGWLYLIDTLYRFTPRSWFAPYVLGGVGVTSLKPSGNDATQQGNINAGFGAQLFADKAIAVKVDVRDMYTIIGGKNDVMFNAGVSFLWL